MNIDTLGHFRWPPRRTPPPRPRHNNIYFLSTFLHLGCLVSANFWLPGSSMRNIGSACRTWRQFSGRWWLNLGIKSLCLIAKIGHCQALRSVSVPPLLVWPSQHLDIIQDHTPADKTHFTVSLTRACSASNEGYLKVRNHGEGPY